MYTTGDLIAATIVDLLREARQHRGITMEELANRAGIDRTYIGLLEKRDRRPTVAIAARIAVGLGLSFAEVVRQAEQQANIAKPTAPEKDDTEPAIEIIASPPRRVLSPELCRPSPRLSKTTGLDCEILCRSIESAYRTLDLIDEQLHERGSDPLSQLVELANLSSILGNLLGSGVANSSNNMYTRNGPHKYPDLLPLTPNIQGIEIKTALEGNRPKGHLAKAGAYLTFRYVLTSQTNGYIRGKNFRGDTISIWEVKFGLLTIEDFNLSSTAGDSGKTAVVKSDSFSAMELLYFDPDFCPSPSLLKKYTRD